MAKVIDKPTTIKRPIRRPTKTPGEYNDLVLLQRSKVAFHGAWVKRAPAIMMTANLSMFSFPGGQPGRGCVANAAEEHL